jgi:hypothetical protein
MRELFEEDSDCADTTLDSSVFSSAKSSRVPSPIMTDVDRITAELAKLRRLQESFCVIQKMVEEQWDMANMTSIDSGDLGFA